MFLLFVIALLVCVPLAIYVFTRPSLPKKYLIFNKYDTIEDHYSGAIGHLRTVISDSLSLYCSYNAEAFLQFVHNIEIKLDAILVELNDFDNHWQAFERFKAQSRYVSTCKQYSLSRRSKIATAKLFVKDSLPFMEITNDLRHLQQAAQNIIVSNHDDSVDDKVGGLHDQTKDLYKRVENLRAHHPVTIQYQQYILRFLGRQLEHIDTVLQSGSSQVMHVFNTYVDTWAHFNDSQVIDVINDEFSWQIDSSQVSMNELRQQTDYDS